MSKTARDVVALAAAYTTWKVVRGDWALKVRIVR